LIYSQAGHAGHILDIGCGTGAFLYHVKKQGWKVKGIEPDHKARAIASKLLEQEIGNTSDLTAYKAGQFDMVTLWHVLEHIPDLSQMLKQIHFVLQEKGLVLIAVPNSLSYDAQHYKEYWAAYDVPRHLWHFTPDTMQALMTKESFDLVKILPMWFDSFYVSMLSEKFQHRSNGIVGGILNGFISNAKALFSNENKYSSQIYMFRKR
jgi:ubiquinone/menaquinone biosynthesis C-methylase UbiE